MRVRAPQIDHVTGFAIAHGLRSQLLLVGTTFPLPVLNASVAHAALAFAGVLLRPAAPRIACGCLLGRNRLQGLAPSAAVMPTACNRFARGCGDGTQRPFAAPVRRYTFSQRQCGEGQQMFRYLCPAGLANRALEGLEIAAFASSPDACTAAIAGALAAKLCAAHHCMNQP